MSQIELLRDRTYWPLFGAQVFGVFTHYALLSGALVTLMGAEQAEGGSRGLLAVGGILVFGASALVAPWVGKLFAQSSQVKIARVVKGCEVGLTSLAFLSGGSSVTWCFIVLAAFGAQSALSEIGRFSLLPELTAKEDLLPGNALLASSGFLSAFFGVALGGACLQSYLSLRDVVAVAFASSLLGLAFALAFANQSANQRAGGAPVSRQSVVVAPLSARYFLHERALLLPSLGVAWFWFFSVGLGICVSREVQALPNVDAGVTVIGVLVFCLGAALGASLCEKLSQGRLELGVVPLGSFGLTLFLLDLILMRVGAGYFPADSATHNPLSYQTLRVAGAVFLLGVFASIFVVPLRTLLQQRNRKVARAHLLAASQVLNGLCAAVSIVIFGLLLQSTPTWVPFVVLLLANTAVSAYIYRLLPEFLLRFVLWCVSRVMYRVRVLGAEFLPEEGACVLVCNHVSFVDWMIIGAACPRPVRFVMYHRYFRLPLLGFLLRDAQVIPIAPAHEDAGVLDEAFDKIAEGLEQGCVVCIFPEGKLTTDGKLNKFRTGIERVITRTPVPVIPMALDGMWGSFFSRKDSEQFQKPFRRVWSELQLIIGPPIAPQDVNVTRLERAVAGLGGFSLPTETSRQ